MALRRFPISTWTTSPTNAARYIAADLAALCCIAIEWASIKSIDETAQDRIVNHYQTLPEVVVIKRVDCTLYEDYH